MAKIRFFSKVKLNIPPQCLECDELQDARIPLQEEISVLKESLDTNESLLKYRTEVQATSLRRPVTAAQLSGQKLSSASQRYVTDDVTVKRVPSAPARATRAEQDQNKRKEFAAHTDSTSL